ncbi:MAG: maltose alpha-D-glucosyltransferase [Hyphomicrobiales bacterium]
MIDRSDPQWYRDAVVYQLHIKAFQDANNDGIGDFTGLINRLDYVHDLGVTAIWLLPFYPSPLRDDGYDIADYRAINSSYGTMREFRRFIAEAHKRDIRIITELVINHTSDQHPWFQRARHAKSGSAWRNYYVWSDTDQKYSGTRIIFCDTETSNWTWDPEAEAFFWHRFYSHQPDLNFDNPRVLEEVTKVLHFWLEMGVDGLRLDAVPYLVEREGTNNENLAETHDVLRKIRAEVDARYPDRLLLAEANQWPEDTRPYFGEGDECHMAFHFPLMPRIYMALAQEDRHPITDIINQTPDIPDNCQWAIFLRNHDELTLEMVTDSERDYLWNTYAMDPRARINLGIRRRLAPLLENDRRKIELLNALLLSMPGTPVIYYGDELGMGDNYFLGDRDGVRTPMQWSADRNGGFSRADPQYLYLPPIMDPIYGYEAINVERQQKDTSSILNWTRRMIAVRKSSAAFGRGTMTFLYPRNRKVLAYLRKHEDETILCVFNLSRAAQAVELDLSEYKGTVPVEMTGRAAFPPVGELPYLLTLPAHGFFWFVLAEETEAPAWHQPATEPLPDFMTLVLTQGWRTVTEGVHARQFQRNTLPAYLANQRWFAAKDRHIESVSLEPWTEISGAGGGSYLLAAVDMKFAGGESQLYFLPLGLGWTEAYLKHGSPQLANTLAKIRRGAKLGALLDAAAEPEFADSLLRRLQSAGEGESDDSVHYEATERLKELQLPEIHESRRPTTEQSNVSVVLGNEVVLKLYRRLQAGIQPEIEVSRFLTEAGFANTPPFLGSIEHRPEDGEPVSIAVAFKFLINQGNGWDVLLGALDRYIEEREIAPADPEREPPEPDYGMLLDLVRTLGQRTAEMHCAFASKTKDKAFRAEPVTEPDTRRWSRHVLGQSKRAFAALKQVRRAVGDDEETRDAIDALLKRQRDVTRRIEKFAKMKPSGFKMRHHGDYHLGQVLVAQNDIYVIDLEGEPLRSLKERRAKTDPVRDVAGMLRSFDYAAATALQRSIERGLGQRETVEKIAFEWRDAAQELFLKTYAETLASCDHWPSGVEETLSRLDLFLLEKVLYEVSYEAGNRPAWVGIPVKGALRLLNQTTKGAS